jgi:putative hydrolase of the HAD superfamily
MIKALIFDFDGLMLDTEMPEYLALNEVYSEMGQHLAIETYGLVVGSQYSQQYEPVAHLQALTGRSLEREAFWQRVNQRRLELIEQSPILPGVEDYLRRARALGLKLALASSSSHAWVDRHLQRHGLLDFFHARKCKEDVANIKPAPDLFLAALDALQVQAQEAVIFEDSAHGVLAANRTGVRVVLVPNPITRHLNISGETLRLASLADLSLDNLLSQL